MKNSNDTIGNRTRDLPTCSAVPQQTALQRASFNTVTKGNIQLSLVGIDAQCGTSVPQVLMLPFLKIFSLPAVFYC